MTDQQDPAQEPVYVASAVVADEQGIEAAGTIVMQGDAVILAARFADPAAAGVAYERLLDAEVNQELNIDGVLVADADADGKIHVRKLTDHHTRRGTKWGIIGGAALAVIFPPSLIVGAIAGGAAGAILGKTGNIVHEEQGRRRARRGDHARARRASSRSSTSTPSSRSRRPSPRPRRSRPSRSMRKPRKR